MGLPWPGTTIKWEVNHFSTRAPHQTCIHQIVCLLDGNVLPPCRARRSSGAAGLVLRKSRLRLGQLRFLHSYRVETIGFTMGALVLVGSWLARTYILHTT